MADDDGNGQRVTVAVLGERLGQYSKSVDRALADAKEDRQVMIALGNRVSVLETNQVELKAAARSDKWIDRIGILASTIAGVFFGPRQ